MKEIKKCFYCRQPRENKEMIYCKRCWNLIIKGEIQPCAPANHFNPTQQESKHSFLAIDGKEYYASDWQKKQMWKRFEGEKGKQLLKENKKKLEETRIQMIKK